MTIIKAAPKVTHPAQTKVVYFTRALDAVSGNQAVTGVGFSPKSIVVGAQEATLGVGAIGIIGTALPGQQEMGAGGDVTNISVTSSPIFAVTTAGAGQGGILQSLDADGFTINWTKYGAPAAGKTLYCVAICYAN